MALILLGNLGEITRKIQFTRHLITSFQPLPHQREILSEGTKTDMGPFCQDQGRKSGEDRRRKKKVFFAKLPTELQLIY